jgi:hypothetical protein
VPFSVYIESFPILQNEIRENCPYMNLMDDFIQQKFIDGQSGQKFHFADKIIMNLVDLKSKFIIVPELDSHIKVVIREAYGVNTQIQLCKGSIDQGGHADCFLAGEQIGTTEVLYFENLQQDETYSIILDYTSSVLAFHKFEICPHLPIEVSMISKSEAEIVNKAHKDVMELTDKKSRDKLKHIVDRMSNNEKMIVDDPYNEGAFMLTSHSEKDFEVLYSHDFHVGMKMGLYIEIFYSPFDDEVLELYLGERYDSLKE